MMADFAQTMKDWRRMCDTIQNRGGACAQLCPLSSNLVCGNLNDASDEDIREAEDRIVLWAAEHSEPVYPTWWKYMCMIGVIPNSLGDKTLGEVTVERLMHITIPADIAEKLGVEPKEGA